MIDTQLEGKVVLITGANHGIGAASAKALAAQGAKVFITYYREFSEYSSVLLETAKQSGTGGKMLYAAMQQQSGESVADEIIAMGGAASAHHADLADSANIPRLFDRCEQTFGPVDILINNHTHCVPETFDPALESDEEFPIRVTSAASIDAHFMINSRAYALLMAEYLRRYLERGGQWGRIINVSTDAASAHTANISYAASKHAIESYSRSAAAEMGKYGIAVNVVAPGPIQTGYLTPNDVEQIAKNTPLRRVGMPEDVADVIVFLASEQSHWLTGQLLMVGGGWRMPQ